MHAIILVGHGSLLRGSGAAMLRLAAAVRRRGLAPLAAAGFLNYSRPTFAETLARLAARGATQVIVQPYFLIPGWFVHKAIPQLIETAQAEHADLSFCTTRAFEDHPALGAILHRRALEAVPSLRTDASETALLIVAHGSPNPGANWPVEAIAAQLRTAHTFAHVGVSYLGLNTPLLADAIDRLAEQGHRQIVIVPHFLQLGGHVAEDLPAIVGEARKRHPALGLHLSQHLGFDPLLADIVADRYSETMR
jgi:sirohydrochlorin ferrochelatase